MSNHLDGERVYPVLRWEERFGIDPMDYLKLSRGVTQRLTEDLGREPTAAEHNAALDEAKHAVEPGYRAGYQQEAVDAARALVQELQLFIEKNGGKQ